MNLLVMLGAAVVEDAVLEELEADFLLQLI